MSLSTTECINDFCPGCENRSATQFVAEIVGGTSSQRRLQLFRFLHGQERRLPPEGHLRRHLEFAQVLLRFRIRRPGLRQHLRVQSVREQRHLPDRHVESPRLQVRLPGRHVGRLLRSDPGPAVPGNLVGLSGLRSVSLRHGQRLRSQLQQNKRPVRVSGKKENDRIHPF